MGDMTSSARVELRLNAGRKSSGEPVIERVLADRLSDGSYQVAATPAFVLGIAAGDRLKVDGNSYTIVERGRNIAVQVYTASAPLEAVRDLVTLMERQVGARLDSEVADLRVFTVPIGATFAAVEAIVNEFAKQHRGSEWYYANVYEDDGVTPLNWWEDTDAGQYGPRNGQPPGPAALK